MRHHKVFVIKDMTNDTKPVGDNAKLKDKNVH